MHDRLNILAMIKHFCLVLLLMLFAAPLALAEDEKIPAATDEAPASHGFWDVIDHYHQAINSRVDDPVLWFDSFFGDKRIEEEALPVSFVRIGLSARYTEGEGFKFPVRVRANVRMTNLNKRLHLVITGVNEEDIGVTAGDTTDAGKNAADNPNASSLGLRYIVYKELRSWLHFGGGVRLGLPTEYYLRAAYQRLLHIGPDNLIRFSETGFWHSVDGFGESTRFDFEKRLNEVYSSRISTAGTFSEVSQGVDWVAEAIIYRKISRKSAWAYELGTSGHTRPSARVLNYRVGMRYRRNIFRPWLFWEIGPEVNWPYDQENEKFDCVGSIITGIEIQFAD